jgi:hypothetical protein
MLSPGSAVGIAAGYKLDDRVVRVRVPVGSGIFTSCLDLLWDPSILSDGFRRMKKKLHGLSPRANYTDRATAACRRNDCQPLRIEGATWSAWRIPTAVFSVFQTGASTFLSSSSSAVLMRVDPVPDPLLFFGSAGNRTRASGSVARNSDH